ncbi:CIA30 family protein [Polynucleobacter sp. MWH-UH24A]|nr:CIA30 family protein [Polynucleobacter sp. MWH-UH24A]
MDFTNRNTLRDCWIVNDNVMGGLSQSSLREDPQGMFFEGQISRKIMVDLPLCAQPFVSHRELSTLSF